MPVPRWVAKANKRFANPKALERGDWPILTHVGRASGVTYRTPLEAHPTDDGYIFVLMYGSESDWVQNLLAAGTATLDIDNERFDLKDPRLISEEEAWQQLPADTKKPPSFFRVGEFLQVDVVR